MRRALLPVLLALLVGCSTPGADSTAGDPPRGTNAPTVTVTVTADPEVEPAPEATTREPTPEPTTPSSTYSAFGDTYAWTDGVSVTIGPPTTFEPSEFAVVGGAAAHVSFAITIVNGSAAQYEPGQFSLSAQSGNVEAERVFDSEQDILGSPSTVLLPGREVAFTIGFGVADPSDIVMQVRPGFQYDPAIFTS